MSSEQESDFRAYSVIADFDGVMHSSPNVLNHLDATHSPQCLHLDIGGEGRHFNAVNLNPSTHTTCLSGPQLPIPNHLQGRGESIPCSDCSVFLITIENTEITEDMTIEIKRVLDAHGIIRLIHPTGYAAEAHSYVATIVNGKVFRTEEPGQTTTWITLASG